jgi:hypothetical protein
MRHSSPLKFRKRGGTSVQSRTVRRQTEGTKRVFGTYSEEKCKPDIGQGTGT